MLVDQFEEPHTLTLDLTHCTVVYRLQPGGPLGSANMRPLMQLKPKT